MNRFNKIAYRYPVIFSFIIMVFSNVLTEIHFEKYLKSSIHYQSVCYLTGIIEQGLCSILLVVLLWSLNLFKNAGFTNPKDWRQLWLVWPVIILCIVVGWSFFGRNQTIDTSKPIVIILFVLLFLSTGFFEEILFRGVILSVMIRKWGSTRKGIYLAVIVSNLLFGFLHITNFLMGRYSMLSTAAQIIYALFIGVFMAACLLRTHSIWIVIMVHGILNMCGSLSEITVGGNLGLSQVYQTTPGEAMSSILVMLPLLLGGAFYTPEGSTGCSIIGVFRRL